jgi:hypothetical protein
MKLYTWRHINIYEYGGGIVSVIAEDEASARKYAAALLDKEVYADREYDLSTDPEVQDIAPGVGAAYYWEE